MDRRILALVSRACLVCPLRRAAAGYHVRTCRSGGPHLPNHEAIDRDDISMDRARDWAVYRCRSSAYLSTRRA